MTDDIANYDEISDRDKRILGAELEDATRRAYRAGAKGTLWYYGAGMTGIVFCDERQRAYKVARHGKVGRATVAEEAEWLRKASQVPAVAPNVARFERWDGKHGVLVRECARGKVGAWSQGTKLRKVHERIGAAMRQYGWGAPEYKEDSYVIVRGRGPVLVDASMPIRFGGELVKQTLQALKKPMDARTREDLVFALRAERGKTVPPTVANRLLKRLGGELDGASSTATSSRRTAGAVAVAAAIGLGMFLLRRRF
jgi:hypothetical protein